MNCKLTNKTTAYSLPLTLREDFDLVKLYHIDIEKFILQVVLNLNTSLSTIKDKKVFLNQILSLGYFKGQI